MPRTDFFDLACSSSISTMRRWCKEGYPSSWSGQPFGEVMMLAARSGQVVLRDYIRDEIWGSETYVDFEHGLNQCIKQIRTVR